LRAGEKIMVTEENCTVCITIYNPLQIRIGMVKSMTAVWAGHVARMGKKGSAYKMLLGKPERNNLHGITGHRWKGNKINVKDGGWEGMNWIHLSQDRFQ
jgi:hypothetical protein